MNVTRWFTHKAQWNEILIFIPWLHFLHNTYNILYKPTFKSWPQWHTCTHKHWRKIKEKFCHDHMAHALSVSFSHKHHKWFKNLRQTPAGLGDTGSVITASAVISIHRDQWLGYFVYDSVQVRYDWCYCLRKILPSNFSQYAEWTNITVQ